MKSYEQEYKDLAERIYCGLSCGRANNFMINLNCEDMIRLIHGVAYSLFRKPPSAEQVRTTLNKLYVNRIYIENVAGGDSRWNNTGFVAYNIKRTNRVSDIELLSVMDI